MKNLAYNEEDQELIRGINSPTNAPSRPAATPEPVPGMTTSAKVRPQGPTCGECQLQIAEPHRATTPPASPPRHHARFIPPNRPGTARECRKIEVPIRQNRPVCRDQITSAAGKAGNKARLTHARAPEIRIPSSCRRSGNGANKPEPFGMTRCDLPDAPGPCMWRVENRKRSASGMKAEGKQPRDPETRRLVAAQIHLLRERDRPSRRAIAGPVSALSLLPSGRGAHGGRS